MRHGTNVPNTESTHAGPLRSRWTRERVAELKRHPDMTSAELAEAMGSTAAAIRHARSRFGRWPSGTDGLCVVCDARPVFSESREARRWGLCKACYLAERERRAAEEAESARVRQAVRRMRAG